MVDYEKYEMLEDKFEKAPKKLKKMPKPPEDRNKGRKLNHRTKKNRARD